MGSPPLVVGEAIVTLLGRCRERTAARAQARMATLGIHSSDGRGRIASFAAVRGRFVRR